MSAQILCSFSTDQILIVLALQYYRSIFEEHFPSDTAALTVPSVPSVACSTPTALAWDASFQNMNEPSGRAIGAVHNDAY